MQTWPKGFLSMFLASAGALSGLYATFLGYAAALDYHWILRRWLIFTALSICLFGLAIFFGNKWVRRASTALLVLLLLAGIDPAERLFWISSN